MDAWRRKRGVMQRYNLTAQMYDSRYMEEQEAKYQAALSCTVIDGKKTLDVGCGTGLLFRHIAIRSELLVGVDLARKLLVHASERARGFRNVHVVQADADHLPFRTSFFEAVLAFTMLQNMPKPSETLLELKQAAQSDACIVVSGLKKTFSLNSFEDVLETVGLYPDCILDRNFLKCYVAIISLGKNQTNRSLT